jgi:uncharacterized protein (TIGR02611 family)
MGAGAFRSGCGRARTRQLATCHLRRFRKPLCPKCPSVVTPNGVLGFPRIGIVERADAEGYRVDVQGEEVGAHEVDTVTGKGPSGRTRPKGSRAPRFVRRYRALHLTWRAVIFLVGFAIIAAGVAMLVLPGPGWAAIFVGLAVLATEFVWAQRTLGWSRRQAARAAERALDPQVRRRNLALLATVVLLGAAAGAAYVWQYGVPVVDL